MRRSRLLRRFNPAHLPFRIRVAILVPVVLVLVGTLGFRWIEGPTWTWGEAFYMTVITLTTVGFKEVHDLSPAGQLFTTVLCLGGVFTLFYTAGATIRAVVSGEFHDILGKYRMAEELAELEGHLIVCGYGRIGRMISQQFEQQKLNFVVIDSNESVLKDFRPHHGIPLVGDATQDEVLRKAGVERAKALVASLPSDADNLYIVLSSHLINKELFIVARAEDESAETKLRRVGASQVISPQVIGGHRMAQAVMRPNVVRYLEMATFSGQLDYQIDEITVPKTSPLAGKTLRESQIHTEMGVLVVAIQRPNGEMITNPAADVVIEPGCVLIVVGQISSLEKLGLLATGD